MCTRATVVCVSVCCHSSASIRRVCDKLHIPVKSWFNFQGFQLADFAKVLSLPSLACFFFVFARSSTSAICNSLKLRYATSTFDDHYLQVLNVGEWSSFSSALLAMCIYCAWANSAPSILHFSAFILSVANPLRERHI